ncbi:MATE family efflux transporter [Dehalococcoidales bacterium]|nr:MATE family efflux transporter [Dehalococcoidales bacterium]
MFTKRDLTSGSISKNILATTLPLWIGSLFYIGFWGMNIYWISRLGSEAIAAVAIGGAGLMLFLMVFLGLANATIAMIGNLVGGKDIEGANRLAKEILTITFLISLALAIIGYVATPGLLKLLGASSQVWALASGYLTICLLGAIAIFPVHVINAILRGSGEMRLPMFIICGGLTLNAILDPLLILGIGFPQLGVNGAAIALVTSWAIATTVGLWILAKGKSVIKVNFTKNVSSYLPRLATVREVVNLAGVNTIELVGMSIIGLVMMGFVAMWGTYALAAYGIGIRLLMMVSMLGFDLAITSSIIMANNLGAKKVRRAEVSCWIASGFNMLIMGVCGIILFCLASQIIGAFDQTSEVVKIGTEYLRITTPGWLFLAAWIVLRRSFIGAKDVYTPLFISLITLAGLQLPLAFYLPKVVGLSGIWWAILGATVIQGLTSAALFRAGRWKPKEVSGDAKRKA